MRIDSIKIKLLLGERGMNQSDLAEKCGISRQNIQLTLGRGTASATKISKIASALGVSAREIVKEE